MKLCLVEYDLDLGKGLAGSLLPRAVHIADTSRLNTHSRGPSGHPLSAALLLQHAMP
jgi:hypothetical protein